jgi:hypothetical protein
MASKGSLMSVRVVAKALTGRFVQSPAPNAQARRLARLLVTGENLMLYALLVGEKSREAVVRDEEGALERTDKPSDVPVADVDDQGLEPGKRMIRQDVERKSRQIQMIWLICFRGEMRRGRVAVAGCRRVVREYVNEWSRTATRMEGRFCNGLSPGPMPERHWPQRDGDLEGNARRRSHVMPGPEVGPAGVGDIDVHCSWHFRGRQTLANHWSISVGLVYFCFASFNLSTGSN